VAVSAHVLWFILNERFTQTNEKEILNILRTILKINLLIFTPGHDQERTKAFENLNRSLEHNHVESNQLQEGSFYGVTSPGINKSGSFHENHRLVKVCCCNCSVVKQCKLTRKTNRTHGDFGFEDKLRIENFAYGDMQRLLLFEKYFIISLDMHCTIILLLPQTKWEIQKILMTTFHGYAYLKILKDVNWCKAARHVSVENWML